MKKIYSVLIFSVLACFSYAATTVVTNAGNTYTPADIIITEGDTVEFNLNFSHDVVEVSQATYNSNGTLSNGGFTLPFGGGTLTGLTPGVYYYVCTPHAFIGMKGTITVNAAPPSSCDLLISGAFDGPLSGGIPKMMELYVVNNIADLSVYGLSSVTNGSGTTGTPEFTFPAVAATAGDYIYLSTDSTSVNTYFGFFPDYTDNFMSVNGDDALELFLNGTVVDVFGEVDCDPNTAPGSGICPGWEYLDGWAYRNNGETCSASFSESDWTFSGANANDGETSNATAANPIPVGTFEVVATPKINIQTASFTINEGDPTTIVTNFLINPTVPNTTTIEIHLVGGNGSSADLDLTAFGGGPFPLTIPLAANNGNFTVPITPNDDAVYEGTETFNFVLRNPTGGLSLGTDTTFILTMTDNELPPDTTVVANPTTVNTNEGAGTVDLSFEIGQLSAGSTTFTADVQLISGDAADIAGYTTQTISFPSSGTTTVNLTINITDDIIIEGADTLIFELVNPSPGLTIGANRFDTLIIEDNDIPFSTIGAVTTVDANGNPTEFGNTFVLYGVVNSPDRGFNSTEFSFQDASGAITAYQSGTTITYNATVGDSIELTGTIGQRFGVTVVTSLTSVNLLSTGASVSESVATLPMESNESSLIRVNGLQLVDAAQWTTGSGSSGFDVEVFTATNDTFILRIDRDYDDLYNSNDIPCGVFDVIGVGGQYDIATPFTENYQLLPRFLSDIIDTCTIVPPTMTLDALTVVDAAGEPVMAGTDVVVRGIITSPDFRELQGEGTEFSFSDGTGSVWAYSSDSAISFNPVVGDSVEVIGNIGTSFSGVTRLYIDAVTSLGAATPFAPSVITTALSESTEAELITLENLTITSGTWATSGGSYNLTATNSNGTYEIRVDADRAELFQPILSGGETFHLTGIGTQFDNTAPKTEGYQILPRFQSDIDIQTSVKEIELANFSVSPVPATERLNVRFDFDKQETATAKLINVIGQVSSSQTFQLSKGGNAHSIVLSELTPGFYILQIETSEGVSNTSVLLK